MYAIINIVEKYDGTTEKTWVSDDTGKAMLFDTKSEAQEFCDDLDGDDVMYLGHNEYSNRYYVRRLTAKQLHRLQSRGW